MSQTRRFLSPNIYFLCLMVVTASNLVGQLPPWARWTKMALLTVLMIGLFIEGIKAPPPTHKVRLYSYGFMVMFFGTGVISIWRAPALAHIVLVPLFLLFLALFITEVRKKPPVATDTSIPSPQA